MSKIHVSKSSHPMAWIPAVVFASSLGLVGSSALAINLVAWDVANQPTGGAWNVGSNWVGGSVPDGTIGQEAYLVYDASMTGPRVVTLTGGTTGSFGMYPTGLTSGNVFLTAAGALNATTPPAVMSVSQQYQLVVSGESTSNKFAWTFDAANNGLFMLQGNRADLTNVNLVWNGETSSSNAGYSAYGLGFDFGAANGNLYIRAGNWASLAPSLKTGIFMTNSDITMSNMSSWAAVGGTTQTGRFAILTGRNAQPGNYFEMTGGSLSVTNPISNENMGAAAVEFGVAKTAGFFDDRKASADKALLDNVNVNVDNLMLQHSELQWNVGSATATINNRLHLAGSLMTLNGGTVTVANNPALYGANLRFDDNSFGDSSSLANFEATSRMAYLKLVNGAILNVPGIMNMGDNNVPVRTQGINKGTEISIENNSQLNVGTAWIGEGSGLTTGQGEIYTAVVIKDSGSFNVSGVTTLAYDGGSAGQNPYVTHGLRGGIGRLKIEGANATFTTTNLVVGRTDFAGSANFTTGQNITGSGGAYQQSNGHATVNGVVELMTPTMDDIGSTYDARYGTRGFQVGADAVLELKGAGFVKKTYIVSGNPREFNWDARLLNSTDLSFAGTLKFAPTVHGTPQSLLSFGVEAGQWAANFDPNNFMVGTIDLTGQDSTDLLTVVGAKNQVVPTPTVNALYVNKFVGLSPADVTSRLDSAQNIYYDPTAAGTSLNTYKVYQLTSGGKVIPKNAGDYNADLALTSADLTTFAANYGSVTPGTAPYDLDGNGTVGNADVNVWFNLLGGPVLLGDMNSDGVVNNQDIAAFVMALTDEPSWQTTYPAPNLLTVGDINGDLAFNNQDIAPFVTLLTGGGGTTLSAGEVNAIPEPASLGLLAAGGLVLISRRRRA